MKQSLEYAQTGKKKVMKKFQLEKDDFLDEEEQIKFEDEYENFNDLF